MVVDPREVVDQIHRDEGGLHIGPSSIDLHIAGEKTKLVEQCDNDKPRYSYYHDEFVPENIEIKNEASYPDEEVVECDTIEVKPDEFCLARSQEVLDLQPNIGATVSGRSSVGRLGLFVENAGLVDRGFHGTITLELYNATNATIEIPAETRVAQLVFFRQQGNKANAYDGKYNGQVEPTGSRLHADEDL